MITVAVTGGIGSGKSTVSRKLQDLGAVLADSDVLAREVVAPGTPGLAEIESAFGSAVITPEGSLDRAALAGIVFADQTARQVLEGITHPRVRARYAEITAAAPSDAVVVNDIPLLTDLVTAASYHMVIGVQVATEVRVPRLVARGLTEADARARIAAQISDADRQPLCDVLLDNNGDRADLTRRVERLWAERLRPFEANVRLGTPADRSFGIPAGSMPGDARRLADGRRLAARASAATGFPVAPIDPSAGARNPAAGIIELRVAVPDLAVAADLVAPLTAAGWPPCGDQATGIEGGDGVASGQGAAGAAGGQVSERRHCNADPGQPVNLYLRVADPQQ